MPESQFISAAVAKRLITYCAVAFAVVVIVGTLMPSGTARTLLVVAWIVGFPAGGWMIYRRGGER